MILSFSDGLEADCVDYFGNTVTHGHFYVPGKGQSLEVFKITSAPFQVPVSAQNVFAMTANPCSAKLFTACHRW